MSGDKLYVSNYANNTIGLYNANTGTTINSRFISSGLHNPGDIALSGGKLFVSNGNDRVGVYDASTGATIDRFYITPQSGGDIGIGGIAVFGGNLFVVNGSETIGKYDATTGAPIKRRFISSESFLESIAMSGGNLFVTIANTSNNAVGKYDATTGATIDSSFISFPGESD